MKVCNICGEKLKKTENFDEVVFECSNTNITVEDDLLLTSRTTRILKNLNIKNKCELLGSDINIFTHKTKREIISYKEEVELLRDYMQGFKDELNNESVNCDSKAYKLGALHAIIGDDNFNIDMLSDEDILRMIRDEQYFQA